MLVGSDNSVRSIFNAMPRVAVSVFGGEKMDVKTEEPPPRKSEEELLAELYERTAQQWLDSDDINQDGLVSKDEYMAGQKRLGDADNRHFDLAAEEERWSKFDPEGKGAIDKDEIIKGLKVVLPLTAHYLEPGVADRIREQALEAALKSVQDFGDAVEKANKKPAMAETIKTTIAAQASLLSLYDEFK